MKIAFITLIVIGIAYGPCFSHPAYSTASLKKNNTACTWNSSFKYPANNANYEEGKAVYVRIDPQKYQDIEYMELYVNNKLVRKESSHPYEWAKGSGNSDGHLRNLKPGTYKLKAKIKDKCGDFHELFCTFYVKNGNGACVSEVRYKYPENNGNYEEGKSVYVRIDPKKYQDLEFIELYVNGKLVRKESSYPYEWAKGSGNSDGHLRNLKPGTYKLKAKIKDKCGKYHEEFCTFYVKAGNGNGACVSEAWYKYPENNGNYEEGKSVHVRIDPKKYQDLEFVELYINDKLVRKESSYPYEWAKGSGNSDGYLRNMKPGTYKLKARIKDKCGKYHEEFCTFYVKSGNGNGACVSEVWYKYPENNGNYEEGKSVHVRIDPKKYQDLEFVELYINNKLVRKESSYPYEWAKGSGNSDGYLRNMKPGTYKLKARIKDKCGKYHEEFCTFYVKSGNGNNACKYKSWYKYPKNNGTYKYGDDVYVRVDTEKYQDVDFMELYVNGKSVRKESNHPYEWAKGNGNGDGYLRDLKRGTYNLKTRVKTKCGNWYEYFCKFSVR